MVKEIEKTGLPVVHVATVLPISQTVGANRIVPAVAIPHPLGNPDLSKKDEKALRREIVEKALEALQTDINEQTVFLDEE
ncbi:glycine/betaine/sarcosine/D-proline reductase family selenoprotein B [Halanaerobium sp. MA284_MarDTE_T2]|nr:glycine/betaine/sarcosine/D-proline reductase family selenoprotein B [Halanaerobium sp. MA284_MarDTE_T2]RCW77875.1 glycine/betaine/sarcosine/D-proline reductase family selenoprotein B [Halanaerobium sp. DL-01]